MIRTYSQMHGTDKYSQHNSMIWSVWLNGRVFVYELSGCGSSPVGIIRDYCNCYKRKKNFAEQIFFFKVQKFLMKQIKYFKLGARQLHFPKYKNVFVFCFFYHIKKIQKNFRHMRKILRSEAKNCARQLHVILLLLQKKTNSLQIKKSC